MLSSLPPYDFSQPHLLSLFLLLPFFWLWQWRAFRRLPLFLSLLLHSLVFGSIDSCCRRTPYVSPRCSQYPVLLSRPFPSLTDPQRQWIQENVEQQLRPKPIHQQSSLLAPHNKCAGEKQKRCSPLLRKIYNGMKPTSPEHSLRCWKTNRTATSISSAMAGKSDLKQRVRNPTTPTRTVRQRNSSSRC